MFPQKTTEETFRKDRIITCFWGFGQNEAENFINVFSHKGVISDIDKIVSMELLRQNSD